MKRFFLFATCLLILIVGGVFAYQKRVGFHEWLIASLREPLPPAESYRPTGIQKTTSTQSVSPVVRPMTKSLPAQKHLLVPFTTQAPLANWDMPYQEACEEASIIMISGYYRGETGTYVSSTANQMILNLVAFEENEFGFGADITADEMVRVIEAYDMSLEAEVIPFKDANSIKKYIADGIPVIVPADGKALGNPNFLNGGPLYHMLVITGYTEDKFITNDPGTRKGFDYVYEQDILINAIHDWNGGDVPNGDKVMIIVRPK